MKLTKREKLGKRREALVKLGPSYSLAFSADAARIAAVSQAVSVFEFSTGARLFRSKPFRHPSEAVFSPDGQTLLVKSTAGRIALLNAADGVVVRVLDKGTCEGCAPRFSTCGRYVLDGSWNGELRLRDVMTGGVAWSRQFAEEMIEAVHCLSGRSQWLVLHCPRAAKADRPPAPTYISLWSHPEPAPTPSRIVRPGLAFVSSSAPSPDGRALAIVHGAPPNNLAIIDLQSGALLREHSVVSGGCGTALAWSTDDTIASVQDGRVELYAARSLKHLGGVALTYASAVQWSPDGRYLALGSWRTGYVAPSSEILGVAQQGDAPDERRPARDRGAARR